MARILVIDPSRRNRTQVERILRLRSEHQVLMAEDGAQAFETLKEGLPDLILMDVFLPRVDGFHVYRVLKERPATARIPVILSTSVALDPMTEARIRKLKIEGRVEMPVSSAELMEVVTLVLIRHQATEPLSQVESGLDSQRVAAVNWPRIARPDPPPEPAKPSPPAEKTVRPVVWPSGGGSQGGRREGAGPAGQEAPDATAQTDRPLSGRELRARLAMLATGKVPIDPPKERPGEREKGSEGRGAAGLKDRAARAAARGEMESSQGVGRVPEGLREGTEARRDQVVRKKRPTESTDPTYAERLQALLKHVGKLDLAPQEGPTAFRELGTQEAGPGRIVDFTRKAREGNLTSNTGDPATAGGRGEKSAGSHSDKGSQDSSKGEEGDPVVRPVHWTQIKKDT